MSVPVTGELMRPGTTYAPFTMGSPNGYEMENCVAVHVVRGSYSDEPCHKKSCGFCDLNNVPKIQIRYIPTAGWKGLPSGFYICGQISGDCAHLHFSTPSTAGQPPPSS